MNIKSLFCSHKYLENKISAHAENVLSMCLISDYPNGHNYVLRCKRCKKKFILLDKKYWSK